MSDAVRIPRKPLRAHLIAPVPLAAGFGLLCAGVENAEAIEPPSINLNVPIAQGTPYQYATVPGTETAGNFLTTSGEMLVYPTANTPQTATYGMAEFTTDGNILYDLTSCPTPGSSEDLFYSTSVSNGYAQINFVAPAVDDTYSTVQGAGITFDVESNDVLPLTANTAFHLSLSGFTTPANGTLTQISNGQFRYVPNAGFTGTDTFTYTLNTGLNCAVQPTGASPSAHAAAAIKPTNAIQAAVQAVAGDPATALVTIQVRASSPAATAPASGAVGLGVLASLLAWFGLRRRRET